MDLTIAGAPEPDIEEEPVLLGSKGVDDEDAARLAGSSVSMEDDTRDPIERPAGELSEDGRDQPMDE